MSNPEFPPARSETYLEPDVRTPSHQYVFCCWCGTYLSPGMVVTESLKTMRRLCPDCAWDIDVSRENWLRSFKP